MHISEGVLSAPVLAAGAAFAVAGCSVGLKKMDYDRIPEVAVLSSTFFVASLVHVPIGPSSVHLLLNGVIGLLLGWAAFPAILVALTLQSILFQFGGITALGVNTVNVVVPALVCFYLFHHAVMRDNVIISLGAAFVCGFSAVLLTSLMVGLSLFLTGEMFLSVSKLVIVAHFPVMIIEGIITTFCVIFLKKVKPELLGGTHALGNSQQ
jgi:cobalt/nickel transport system permease protein